LPIRFTLLALILLVSIQGNGQKLLSTGVFTGFNIPLTLDQGINMDPRYQIRYDIKWVPLGVNVDVDLEGYSFMTNPSFMTIGQNFYVANTVGGQVGRRTINLTYFQLPVGMKVHIIDLSFFRISAVASVGFSYLLTGEERITHDVSKMWFPDPVLPKLPPTYTVEYDGVIVPELKKELLVGTGDYKPIQLFGAAGLRSDWDVSSTTRLSMDLRVNMNFTDPRDAAYLDKVKSYDAFYDLYGTRTDLYITFTVGVARILELEKQTSQAPRNKYKPKHKLRSPK
jgi:hypothetical protein